jgi:hypothetical protein
MLSTMYFPRATESCWPVFCALSSRCAQLLVPAVASSNDKAAMLMTFKIRLLA